MNTISITYDEGTNSNKNKKIIINEQCAVIYSGYQVIVQCKSSGICKRILDNVYEPIKTTIYDIYMHTPSLKEYPNKRLEIIEGYNTMVFDMKHRNTILEKFISDLEEQIRRGVWDSKATKRKIDKTIENSPLSWFTKRLKTKS